MSLTLPFTEYPTAPESLSAYDWIVISSSGGKDSQAMLDVVCTLAETDGLLSRVVVVHCDLGRVEWPGTKEIAEEQARRYGVRFLAVHRGQGDLIDEILHRGMFPGPETRFCTAHHKTSQVYKVFTELSEDTRKKQKADLLSHIEERGMFPDARRRYCTSDHKRSQVHKVFTVLSSETRKEKPGPVQILSCMGMRADESPARAKRQPFVRDDAASSGRRAVDSWLPLHQWRESQVWERIRNCRTADLIHYAYGLGMPRVSCCFCIFAPLPALVIAGRHNPELLREYVRVEEKIGHRFRVNLSMADVLKAVESGDDVGPVADWRM